MTISPAISKQPEPINTIDVECHEGVKSAFLRNYDVFPRFTDEEDLIYSSYLLSLELIVTLRMLFNIKNGIETSNKSELVKQLQEDINNRNSMGKENYGVSLSPFNGRDFVIDAYQEGLDLGAYVFGLVYESNHKE